MIYLRSLLADLYDVEQVGEERVSAIHAVESAIAI